MDSPPTKQEMSLRQEMAETIQRGHIDGFLEGRLRGWAFDSSDPTRRIELAMFIDGRATGLCTADGFRQDLRMAGFGTGEHAFAFDVPREFLDGQKHQIDVVDPVKRIPLPNSPQMVFLPLPSGRQEGRIERLDGPMLLGWLSDGSQPDEPIDFTLREGGRDLARGTAETRRPDGSFAFSIRLPDTVCDGRPHAFTVETDQPLASIAVITPFLSTPDEVLADFASTQLKGRLSNAATHRYQALLEQMERIGGLSGEVAAATARDVTITHGFLIHGAKKKGLDDIYEPFAFSEVAEPIASVLVPVHNKFSYTYHCLASLRLMPNDVPFEVIVLDDGSSDETEKLGEIVGGVRVVRNKAPLGFLRNCNAGVPHARGKYVVLLNNDTEVTPHWLDHLLRPFDLFDEVGLVGAKLLFADGTLQEAGGLVWRDGSVWNYGRGGNPRDPRYSYLRETDYCSGACIALERQLWDELGGFDEDFAPAYYEDTDLAFRVRATGRRVLYQPLCELIHFEGASSGTDATSGVKRYQAINQPKFLSRWSRDFRGNGMPGDEPDFNKERGYARHVLVIDTEVPQPDRSAGHYAAIQEIRILQSLGFKPTFLPENMAHLGRYNDNLAQMGVEAVHAPFFITPEDFLRKRGHEFDLVYITRYHVAANLIDLVRRHCPRAKVVFNNADLHFLRLLRTAIAEKTQEKIEEARQVRDEELAVMRRVDLTLSYNDVEHAVILSHNLDQTKIAKCPWVVTPRHDVPPFESRKDIAFLGGFRHPPNLEAARFFAREVMPLLRHSLPGVRFRIYGSYPPKELYELENDDVVVEGFVEHLEDVFDTCRVFVAPLLTGAGIKGKVLDALSNGVPSVLSSIAAEGTGVRHGVECFIADEPNEWSAHLASVYHDKDLWTVQSRAAIEFSRSSYSFEAGQKAFCNALQKVDSVVVPTAMHLKIKSCLLA